MSLDRALDRLFSLRLHNGELWGAVARGFQIADARAILDPHSTARCLYITRARGASKTTNLGAIVIVLLLDILPPGARVYAIAADLDQGRLLLDAVRGFVQRTPSLQSEFLIFSSVVKASRDRQLVILPCDDASIWGLRPDFVICDELGQWPDTDRARMRFESLATSLHKVPGRMTVITTPGSPGHWSHSLLEFARADPDWDTRETIGPAPWVDPALLEAERRRLTPSKYARLHEGRWTEPDDRLALLEHIRACVDPNLNGLPQREHEYVIGVDLSLKLDRTAIAIAHGERVPPGRDTDPLRIIIDQLRVWTPTPTEQVPHDEVEHWIAQHARRYHDARIVIDSWNAAGMSQRLRNQGLRVKEFTATQGSNGQLAITLHQLIRQRLLALPDDPETIHELANVQLRETTPGAYRLDHAPGKHDDRAIAIGLGALDITQHPPGKGPRVRRLH